MKKWIARLNSSYIETFLQFRLFSQIDVFLITVVLIIEFLDVLGRIYQIDKLTANQWNIVLKIFFSFGLMLFLFGSQFLILFSRRKIFAGLSVLIWLTTYITLQLHMSSLEFGGCTKNLFPEFGENLSYIFAVYILLSPLYQLGIFLISFLRCAETRTK